MNEIPTYNHSKKEAEYEQGTSFFHLAAKLCLFAPIFSVIFVKSVLYAIKDEKGPWITLAMAGTGMVSAAIFAGAIVLGIVALAGIPRHGREGILWRSLFGILLSTLLLGIWGNGFVRGFQTAMQNRKAVAEIKETSAEMNNDLKKEFDAKGSLGPTAGQEQVQKMKSAFDQASKKLAGDDALVAKAASAYVAKMQGLLTNYSAAALTLRNPPVLSMKLVEKREQLQAKKEIVNHFLEANEKLMAFFTKGDAALREELVREKVSAYSVEETLKGYRKTAEERNFLGVKIRMTDERIGRAMLEMLNLLDTQWGNWNYNAEKKKVIFQDTDVAAQYNESFEALNTAATEQAQLQREMVNLPATASAQ